MSAGQNTGTGGSKGSDTAHTPVESPDSLIDTSYANILDAVSEGPIFGLVNGAQSIFYNQTPLANSDGSLNFTGVTWDQRTGEAEQDYITGFPAVESETNVGVELKFSQSWTQAINNLQLSAVRVRIGVSTLYQTEADGDTVGYLVNYAIDVSTDGSDYVTVLSPAFNGKTTTGYQRSHRIDLPKATSGWRIRIRRLTADSTVSAIQANTSIVSYTEVIDAKLQYPFTALVGTKIDASQFSSIPERAFRIKGRIVQVPTNYDPATRIYSGAWDGTFKLAWTDNPAWVYRDLILNDRYGLGSVITSDQVDKWGLYQIAGYCDEMVSNGKGGLEPRFSTNLYLQSRANALTVLQDMASVFRGMSYYAASEVMVSADMPSDPVYTYTNGNVIGGKFSRAGSSGSTRFSVCKVSWSDRENFGATKVEYVQDQRSIARYGIRETEVTAFACVSQGQAQRIGHYILLTNQLETDTISFSVGLDGTLARPGQLIRVSDEHYVGKPMAGRIKASTVNTVTLDNDVVAAAGDTLIIILPTGTAETRVIQSFAGRVVTVTESFSSAPVAQSIYTIETAEVVSEVYRILSVVENFGDDKLQYDVVAVQHNASKFAAIDNGAQIVTMPTTVLPSAVQAIPTGVALSTFDSVKQGLAVATMRITWNPSVGAASYNVWWRRGSSDWVYGGVTYTASLEVPGIYSGMYTARIAAIGVTGNSSLWAYSDPTELLGKTGNPPAITSLTATSLLFGIGLKWGFPVGAEDTQRTELWYGPANNLSAATKLADLAYPQSDYSMQQLKAGATLFFWARLVDRSGNIGPFYPTVDGVVGQASSDATAILDQIAGEITKSALGQELLSEIEKIDGNGPGSVNVRIDEAKAALELQVVEVNDAVAGVRSDLDTQVTEINGTITTAKNDLQTQINSVSTTANALTYVSTKTYAIGETARVGQRLYQAFAAVPVNTSPPNTAYWLDVGSIVVSANGLATRVTTAETKITSIEGVNTAQSSSITGVQSALTGKADAAAVNSLTTRVTTAEGSITTQGQAITGLTNTVAGKADAAALNSLTTRVTSAEGINTSQGTAIINLTNAVTGKADASAVTALTTRVTATEGKNADQDTSITSQGQAITSLNNSVAGKADASAVTALTTRVTGAEGVNTAQAGQITSLTTTVSGKADSATVSALSNTVTQHGVDITAQGQALTNVTASIGNVGGENLLFNPSFERGAGTADGWVLNGSATVAVSMVPSTLDPVGKAQRLDLTIPGAAYYTDLSPGINLEPAVSPGRVVTMSAYVRATAGMITQLYLQWRNAAGATFLTDGTTSLNATGDWQRTSRTSAVVPAEAVSVHLIYRTRGPVSGVSITGFAEWDRAQFELGACVSGWRDNNSLTDAAVTANAAATTALKSTVTQQGTALTSLSTQVTSLDTTVNSITDGLATKATAAALTALTSRVTTAEGVNTSQSTSITDLNSSITSIQGSLGASGLDPAEGGMWQFDAGVEGWTAANATVAASATGMLVTASTTDPQLNSPIFSVPGASYTKVRARITRTAGAASDWDGKLYYSNSGHGASSSYYKAVANPNLVVGASATVEWDMSSLTAGGTDWVTTTITRMRIDLSATAGGAFDIDWVAIGRSAPSASSRALSSLASTVTAQGTNVTAQAALITSLQSTVAATNAAAQTEATTRANADGALATRIDGVQATAGSASANAQTALTAIADVSGKSSAMWSVKLGVDTGGRYYVAGIGLGLENNGGNLQSTFIVSADKFAIINGLGGSPVSPFAVANGQTFIADAFINKATITSGIIGQTLTSGTMTSYGQAVMTVDFNIGQVVMCNKATNGKYITLNQDGLTMISGGVKILELVM